MNYPVSEHRIYSTAEIEELKAENEGLKEIIFSMCIELKKDNSIQQRRAASRKYRQMIEKQEQPQ